MIKTLNIKNYKSLKNFSIEKLGRINLIVGKNNSGKSTVLECLRILAANGNQSIIDEIVEAHDDNILAQNRKTIDEGSIYVYEGLFTNRRFPVDDSPIYIGTTNKRKFVEISKVYFEDTEKEIKSEKGSVIVSRERTVYKESEIEKSSDLSEYEQAILVTTNQNKKRPVFITYNDRSAYYRRSRMPLKNIAKNTPISYIPTQFLSMDLLASLWDQAVLTPYFTNVKKFLNIISEDFEDLAFIKVNRRTRGSDVERTGIIKLKGQAKPIPLNGMGDGVLRILQLVLGMFPAKNGFLLIDEFENGLHYSVQEKIWKLLFELAKEMNIQIFATTHSWDCIESFAKNAQNSAETSVLFRLGKSILKNDFGQTVATVFDQEDLYNLSQSDVELR